MPRAALAEREPPMPDIRIREVPVGIARTLSAWAAARGQSREEFLRDELRKLAARSPVQLPADDGEGP